MKEKSRYLPLLKGALVGTAVGDAVGYPVEFRDDEIVTDMLPPFEYSDDTQMTVATVKGILRTDPDPGSGLPAMEENVASAYVEWNISQDRAENRRAPGGTCLGSTDNLRRGVGWRESGLDSAGCGTTMRMGVLGIMLSEAEIVERGPGIAYMTHNSSRSIAGGVGAALTVKYLVRGMGWAEIINKLHGIFSGREYDHLECPEMAALLERTLALGERLKAGAGRDKWFLRPTPEITEQLGLGWVADECLALSILLCMVVENDFGSAVLAAANLQGSDKDSLGAVAGCFLGALHGIEGIPGKWVEKVEDSGMLQELAEKAHEWKSIHMTGYG